MSIRIISATVAVAGTLLVLAWLRVGDESFEATQAPTNDPTSHLRPETFRPKQPAAVPPRLVDRQLAAENHVGSPAGPPEYLEDLSEAELAELTAEEFAAHALGDHLEKRGEEVRRQQLGQERFAEGVARGDFSAKQMDQAVVAFFNGVHLEPRLDEEGMLESLELAELDLDSPLRDAGFRRGDRITRIDDQELLDPADIPALLVALERDILFCGDRDGEEICGAVSLE